MRSFARRVYFVAASAFLVGVLVQVYLVGLTVMSGLIGFGAHIALGHALALPVLAMVTCAYLGGADRRTGRLSWLLLGVYVIQANVLVFLRSSVPYLAALHPVLALVDIVLGLILVRAGWALVVQLRDDRQARSVAVPS